MQELILKAQDAYERGEPIMSDEAYDLLVEKFGEVEQIGPAGDHPHHKQMYSLQKYYEGEDTLPEWINNQDLVKTPKLDGAAISILYIGGQLTQALTRGDGVYGKDITEKAKYLVPTRIRSDEEFLFITGEVVAPTVTENSRNFCAGSLNLKDIQEFKNRVPQLKFVAYGLRPFMSKTYTQDMWFLSEQLGIPSITYADLSDYPTDGYVVRLNHNDKYEEKGYTSKYPKGAFAVKVRHQGYLTKLTDVQWNTGRTGVVAPVGIVEPVKLDDGATVSRVTLHNIKFIREMDLEIGCLVRIERAGDIIPRVIERVNE